MRRKAAPSLVTYRVQQSPLASSFPVRSVGQMLDAAEKFVAGLPRPDGYQTDRLVAVVHVAVHDHRRDADEIASFPRVFGPFVDIVTPAGDDQQKLLENMPMLAALLSRCDLLRHEIHSARGD